MKFKELKNKSEAEVKQLLAESRSLAHDLQQKLRLGQQKNVKALGKVKKDIARILTFLTSK